MTLDNLTDAEKAWLAGLFEGDGTIGIFKRCKDRRYVRVCFYNNDLPLLKAVQKLIGGYIYERFYQQPKAKNWKRSFSLFINKQKDIKKFIEVIFPFVRGNHRKEQLLKVRKGG